MRQRHSTIARHAEKRYGCDRAGNEPAFDKNAYHNAGQHHAANTATVDGVDYFDNQNRESYAAGRSLQGKSDRPRHPLIRQR